MMSIAESTLSASYTLRCTFLKSTFYFVSLSQNFLYISRISLAIWVPVTIGLSLTFWRTDLLRKTNFLSFFWWSSFSSELSSASSGACWLTLFLAETPVALSPPAAPPPALSLVDFLFLVVFDLWEDWLLDDAPLAVLVATPVVRMLFLRWVYCLVELVAWNAPRPFYATTPSCYVSDCSLL